MFGLANAWPRPCDRRISRVSFSFSCLLETSVDDHQAEDLHNDRHVPLNFALDLALGIRMWLVMRDLRLKASSIGGTCL
jgi:hypothetical protein